MIERIRDGLWYLRLRFFCREKKAGRAKSRNSPCIKGTVCPVIVVKPDNAMFDQALFFLSDEYIRQQSQSTENLLSQAREAAADYMARRPELLAAQGRARRRRWLLLPFFLVALGLAVLYFLPEIAFFCPKA